MQVEKLKYLPYLVRGPFLQPSVFLTLLSTFFSPFFLTSLFY